jgi:hypothetical protein
VSHLLFTIPTPETTESPTSEHVAAPMMRNNFFIFLTSVEHQGGSTDETMQQMQDNQARNRVLVG